MQRSAWMVWLTITEMEHTGSPSTGLVWPCPPSPSSHRRAPSITRTPARSLVDLAILRETWTINSTLHLPVVVTVSMGNRPPREGADREAGDGDAPPSPVSCVSTRRSFPCEVDHPRHPAAHQGLLPPPRRGGGQSEAIGPDTVSRGERIFQECSVKPRRNCPLPPPSSASRLSDLSAMPSRKNPAAGPAPDGRRCSAMPPPPGIRPWRCLSNRGSQAGVQPREFRKTTPT